MQHRRQAASDWVGRTVSDVERDLILATLSHCGGNRTHAARLLGISVRTLRTKAAGYASAGLIVANPRRAHPDAGLARPASR